MLKLSAILNLIAFFLFAVLLGFILAETIFFVSI